MVFWIQVAIPVVYERRSQLHVFIGKHKRYYSYVITWTAKRTILLSRAIERWRLSPTFCDSFQFIPNTDAQWRRREATTCGWRCTHKKFKKPLLWSKFYHVYSLNFHTYKRNALPLIYSNFAMGCSYVWLWHGKADITLAEDHLFYSWLAECGMKPKFCISFWSSKRQKLTQRT